MLENFNEDKRKNSMTQFSDFDSLLSLIFLRCSRTLRFDSLLSPIFKGVHECFAFHTGWSIVKSNKLLFILVLIRMIGCFAFW